MCTKHTLDRMEVTGTTTVVPFWAFLAALCSFTAAYLSSSSFIHASIASPLITAALWLLENWSVFSLEGQMFLIWSCNCCSWDGQGPSGWAKAQQHVQIAGSNCGFVPQLLFWQKREHNMYAGRGHVEFMVISQVSALEHDVMEVILKGVEDGSTLHVGCKEQLQPPSMWLGYCVSYMLSHVLACTRGNINIGWSRRRKQERDPQLLCDKQAAMDQRVQHQVVVKDGLNVPVDKIEWCYLLCSMKERHNWYVMHVHPVSINAFSLSNVLYWLDHILPLSNALTWYHQSTPFWILHSMHPYLLHVHSCTSRSIVQLPLQ